MKRMKFGKPRASISAWVYAGFAGSSGVPIRGEELIEPIDNHIKLKIKNDKNWRARGQPFTVSDYVSRGVSADPIMLNI